MALNILENLSILNACRGPDYASAKISAEYKAFRKNYLQKAQLYYG